MTCVTNGFEGKLGKCKEQRLPCSDFMLGPSGFYGSCKMLLKARGKERELKNLTSACLVSEWLPALGRRWTWGGCLKWASNPKKMPCALVPAQERIRAIKPLDMPMGCVWATGADPQCLCLSPCLSSLASFCWLLSCQKSWVLPPALPAMRGKNPCVWVTTVVA